MKEISALEYQRILFTLPNPLSIVKEGRRQEIEISYIKNPINAGNNIIFGRPFSGISTYGEVETIIFEICHNQSLPFWQPKDVVKILPEIKKENNSIFRS